jgi:hypothetical protein
MIKLAIIRPLPFVLAHFSAMLVFAQAHAQVDLTLRFGPSTTGDQEKWIFEALRDLDPSGTYHYDRGLPGMVLMSSAGIPSTEYVTALSRITGLVITGVTDNIAPAIREQEQVDWPGFPPYVDTGDRVQDDLRYQEAKKDWILAHTAEYEALRNTPSE